MAPWMDFRRTFLVACLCPIRATGVKMKIHKDLLCEKCHIVANSYVDVLGLEFMFGSEATAT